MTKSVDAAHTSLDEAIQSLKEFVEATEKRTNNKRRAKNMTYYEEFYFVAEILAREPRGSLPFFELHKKVGEDPNLAKGSTASDYILDAINLGIIELGVCPSNGLSV
jgi:hypothetical protein